MAFHSSSLSWKIPWTEEPGGLLSMGSAMLTLSLQMVALSRQGQGRKSCYQEGLNIPWRTLPHPNPLWQLTLSKNRDMSEPLRLLRFRFCWDLSLFLPTPPCPSSQKWLPLLELASELHEATTTTFWHLAPHLSTASTWPAFSEK